MRFSLSSAGLQEWNGDVLAVGLPQGDVDATATALEQRFAGITEALKQQEFKGKPGDQLVITPLGGGPQRLVVLGLGESDTIDTERLRGAAARAAKAAIGCEGSLGLHLPWAGTDASEAARICAEAVRLCLYKDQRFRKEPDPRRIPGALELIDLDPAAESGFAAVNATCAGVELARELVAAPPNVVTPAALADTAAGIAKDHGLELKVLERSDFEAKGMGAFLAVSQGSDLPPKFIHLILSLIHI